jgi:hypothetical protein
MTDKLKRLWKEAWRNYEEQQQQKNQKTIKKTQ